MRFFKSKHNCSYLDSYLTSIRWFVWLPWRLNSTIPYNVDNKHWTMSVSNVTCTMYDQRCSQCISSSLVTLQNALKMICLPKIWNVLLLTLVGKVVCTNEKEAHTARVGAWGPFLESPGNFTGPKSKIQIEIIL